MRTLSKILRDENEINKILQEDFQADLFQGFETLVRKAWRSLLISYLRPYRSLGCLWSMLIARIYECSRVRGSGAEEDFRPPWEDDVGMSVLIVLYSRVSKSFVWRNIQPRNKKPGVQWIWFCENAKSNIEMSEFDAVIALSAWVRATGEWSKAIAGGCGLWVLWEFCLNTSYA